MPALHTIGYEGTDIDSFVRCLVKADIEVLVDVRELPLSRKKGFSKNGLRTAVEKIGIKYIHLRSLGDPKPGRAAAKAGKKNEFRRIFDAHLQTSQAQVGLEELRSSALAQRACIMCFEKDHSACHRDIVASELSSEFEVIHLAIE